MVIFEGYKMPLFKFNRFLCLIKSVNKLSIHILVLCLWMESGWLPGLFPVKIWWKLNTDGNSLGILGKAGAGVLIRREDGDWVVLARPSLPSIIDVYAGRRSFPQNFSGGDDFA
ncbi:hypothetical protein Peur_072423 [Populus x canadensis]